VREIRRNQSDSGWRLHILKGYLLSIIQLLGALIVVGLVLALPDRQIKWVVLGIETSFIFGFICNRTREFWANVRYWIFFCSVLVCHLTVGILIQHGRPMIPGAIYLVVGVIEGLALYMAILFLFAGLSKG
jgi:hypothetical protein